MRLLTGKLRMNHFAGIVPAKTFSQVARECHELGYHGDHDLTAEGIRKFKKCHPLTWGIFINAMRLEDNVLP